MISIRRAESSIISAVQIKKQLLELSNGDAKYIALYRTHITKLDDCFLATAEAEHLLAGHSHSVTWWTRLHLLKLLIFAEIHVPKSVENGKASGEDYLAISALTENFEPVTYIQNHFESGIRSLPSNFTLWNFLDVFCQVLVNSKPYFIALFSSLPEDFTIRMLQSASDSVLKYLNISDTHSDLSAPSKLIRYIEEEKLSNKGNNTSAVATEVKTDPAIEVYFNNIVVLMKYILKN
jgi:hypothetical protein